MDFQISISAAYHSQHNKLIPFIFLLLFSLFLSGCGGSSDSSTSISGFVIDGPISNSSVTLHRINSDGSVGAQVAGAFITDALGQWTGSAPSGNTEVLVVVATGGQYTDDATGSTVVLADTETMNSWYDPLEPAENRVVSPITDTLWQVAKMEISQGESLRDAVEIAEQVARDFWGIDPTDVVPDKDSSNASEQRYGVMLASFSFLMDNHASLQVSPFVDMPRFTLMRLLMDDMADGRFDGIDLQGSPLFSSDGTRLPSLSPNDLSAFFKEANDYALILQLDPVEDDINRVLNVGYNIVCPTDGILIYQQGSSGSAGRTVDYDNIRIFSNQTSNSVTNETIFLDSYFIPFINQTTALAFSVSATQSAGSSLTSWIMDLDDGAQYGAFSTFEQELAYKVGGTVIFERDTPFFFYPAFGGDPQPSFICGSFNAGAGTTNFPPSGPNHNDQYYVGGYVHDLNGTLVLQNNGADDKTISSDGRFWFSSLQDDGVFYNISILTQPEGQTCSLSSSAGQISGSNDSSTQVNCVNNPAAFYSVGGNLSGLGNGKSVVLQNNSGDDLSINGNGSFTFTTEIISGGLYDVEVLTQPGGQECSVSNESGSSSSDVTTVLVACVTNTFTITSSASAGGSISPSGNVVVNEGANQSFSFTAESGYQIVNILVNSASEGSIVSYEFTNVSANHFIHVDFALIPTYTIGGTVTNLAAAQTLTLQNNGGDDLVVSANSLINFSSPLESGDSYLVQVSTQPATQTCSILNASGTVGSANISNLSINCIDNPVGSFSVSGEVVGLAIDESVTLQNNAQDNLTVTANGDFTFVTPIDDTNAYDVTVLTPPVGRTCTVTHESGTIDGANVINIFVDCRTAIEDIILISVSNGQANTAGLNSSQGSSLNEDGSLIAFKSVKNNIVTGDSNNTWDAFVRTPATDDTTRVSVDNNGAQIPGASTGTPFISADGEFVVFQSSEKIISDKDYNNANDIYVRSLGTDETLPVSVVPSGYLTGGGTSEGNIISADGRYIAFVSTSPQLGAVSAYSAYSVFRRDMQTGDTIRISNSTTGTAPALNCLNPAISNDGMYVAYRSQSTDLVSGDSNGEFDVFWYNIQTGETRRVNVATDGTQANEGSGHDGNNYDIAISGNGRYVMFNSDATNLVSNDTNAVYDTFVHDTQTGETTRVSVASDGTQASSNETVAHGNAMDELGRYAVFTSYATNLVPVDTNLRTDVFVRDMQTGDIAIVSISATGTQGNGWNFYPAISSDGRYISFDSVSNNLTDTDTDMFWDVYRAPNPLYTAP